ncbi:MAG TPA: hypothetical protein VEN81_13835 [Planctomycetota bacterium]|nr:hypothetical protein [Planctomycetota bacterium]
MTRVRRIGKALVLAWAGAVLGGCGSTRAVPVGNAPERWMLIETPVDRVYPGGWVGDGRVEPGAPLLALERGPGDLQSRVDLDPHGLEVEILEVTPRPPLSPGESVSVRLRMAHPDPEAPYVLEARVSGPDVRLLGPPRTVVRGGAPATIRFTGLSSGPAGIVIRAAPLGSPDGSP